MTRRTLALGLVTLALLTGCGSGAGSSAEPGATTTAPGGAAAVREVSSVLDLRGAFNEDRGSTRLLLVLSPT